MSDAHLKISVQAGGWDATDESTLGGLKLAAQRSVVRDLATPAKVRAQAPHPHAGEVQRARCFCPEHPEPQKRTEQAHFLVKLKRAKVVLSSLFCIRSLTLARTNALTDAAGGIGCHLPGPARRLAIRV